MLYSHKNTSLFMNSNYDRVMLFGALFLNGGVWANNFSLWIKIPLAILAAATTIMAFFNAYKTFERNYRTLWIVVTINHVLTLKKRGRKNIDHNSKKKQDERK